MGCFPICIGASLGWTVRQVASVNVHGATARLPARLAVVHLIVRGPDSSRGNKEHGIQNVYMTLKGSGTGILL